MCRFRFNEVLLTAKGWYESSGNIADDFASALERDYGFPLKLHGDRKKVAEILVCKVLPAIWNIMPEASLKSPVSLYKSDSLIYSVHRIMDLYRIDDYDTAIIHAAREFMCYGITNDLIKLEKPVYRKGLRIGCLFSKKYPISMTYTSMNRIAEKHFGK